LSDAQDLDERPAKDFFQEEYDLRMLIQNVLTRIDMQTVLKHAPGWTNENKYADEFLYFSNKLRDVFLINS